MILNFQQLMDAAQNIVKAQGKPFAVAVAAGQDAAAISALTEAARLGIAQGRLVGDEAAIRDTLNQLAPDHGEAFEIIPGTGEPEIALKCIQLIHQGQADFLMKGKIKTGTLFKAVLDKDSGLRTGQLISDVFMFEFSRAVENHLIMITDGGINLAPDLNQKIQIIENAVLVAHALGNPEPKVAVLSAVETVNSQLPSTIDAALLAKMNDRGQIKHCLIDGPLALDNAISPEAAAGKGIQSSVAGQADILLCPNIESANMLAKGTTWFAGLPLAHTCVGATVPILIPSRSDSAQAKLYSIALSIVVSHHLKNS